MKNNSIALATDFDGTIIKQDFFWHIIDKVLSEEDIEPWDDYKEGRITHFEGLNRIFKKIRIPAKTLHKLIFEISLEDCFLDTIKLCIKNNIKIYIISAGADYYIKLILEELGIKDSIEIIANKSAYSQEQGLIMTKMNESSEFYSANYGVNKVGVIKYLKKHYDKVIFAGDGTPDFEAAKYADIVFARGALLKLCKENNIKADRLDSYCNVFEYIKNNLPQKNCKSEEK